MRKAAIDASLDAFLRSGSSNDRCTVLIEVARPKVAPRARASLSAGPITAPLADNMMAVEHALASMAPDVQPVKLPNTGTFIVDLTSGQLEQLLEVPEVAAIRMSRTHNVG